MLRHQLLRKADADCEGPANFIISLINLYPDLQNVKLQQRDNNPGCLSVEKLEVVLEFMKQYRSVLRKHHQVVTAELMEIIQVFGKSPM